MRKWESHLRRDSAAWSDFKQWLKELETREVHALMTAADVPRQRGIVDGVRAVLFDAELNEKEEKQRARRES